MPYNNLTFLVSSCDKYAVCWAPFCHGLKKYWPEHPQKLVFITNHKAASCGESFKVGEDQGWAHNLLAALEQVETDFILYAQEDYWIKSTVPDANIRNYLIYLETGQADMIRLYPAPGPDAVWEKDARLGVIVPNSQYRVSLQMTLWRKSTLFSLLNPSENPWQFEMKGTKRSQSHNGVFLCVSKRGFGVDYVFTAIKNGYWTEGAQNYAKNEGIMIDFEELALKPPIRRIYDHLKAVGYKVKRKIQKHRS